MAVIGIDASRATSTAPTGTEAYSLHLLRALVPLLSSEHVTRLYFREPPEATPGHSLLVDALSRAEPRVIPFPRLWTHIRLSWEMVRHPPDVLFVPAHVLPLVRPRRSLVTVHDLGYRIFPAAHPASQRRYLDLSTRWNVKVASHILADSAATRDAIVAHYGAPEERITVVHPGYDSDLHPVQDSQALTAVRAHYRIPGDYVLFLGRIQPRKNLVRLIEAFAATLAHHPTLNLVLGGPAGWLSDEIPARIRALGLSERVLVPGYIDPADKATLISGALVFAYPSLYEGFGFPALEAQACGTPLLTSTTSSLPEVAGQGALLVDPQDTAALAQGLRRLLEDSELRRRLVACGYENLARFSWQRAATQVRDIIDALAGP